MLNNPARRAVRLLNKCVEIQGTLWTSPLPNHTKEFYASAEVLHDDLRDQGIFRGDYAVFAFGRKANKGDLAVVNTPFGVEVERFEPRCSCQLLGAVVRIQREITGMLGVLSVLFALQ